MNKQPFISVVMSVHNTEEFLREALESILQQTYRSFELIAVNDGSTDSSPEILREYAGRDSRVIILDNDSKRGVTYSFNRAIGCAKGEYIARMDPDDISLPQRFAVQVEFFRKHPDIVLLGSYINSMDSCGRITGTWRYPLDHLSLKWGLIFSNCFAHPSVMFRREAALSLGGYNEAYLSGMDFDLWVRICRKYRAATIPQVLLHWRTHNNSMTKRNPEFKAMALREILREQLKFYKAQEYNDRDLDFLFRFASGECEPQANMVSAGADVIQGLMRSFVSLNPGIGCFSRQKLMAEKILLLVALNIGSHKRESLGLLLRTLFSGFSFLGLTEINSWRRMLSNLIKA